MVSANLLSDLTASMFNTDTPYRVLHPSNIDPDPDQPRTYFSPEAHQELVGSVRQHGVIQPIVVRPHPGNEDRFMIIAGERRWRASIEAQLDEIPAIVRNLPPDVVLAIQLIENIQREDLVLADAINSVGRLVAKFGRAKAIEMSGKSSGWISKHSSLYLAYEESGLMRDVVDQRRCGDIEALDSLRKLLVEDQAKAEAFLAAHETFTRGDILRLGEGKARAKEAGGKGRERAPAGSGKASVSAPASGVAQKAGSVASEKSAGPAVPREPATVLLAELAGEMVYVLPKPAVPGSVWVSMLDGKGEKMVDCRKTPLRLMGTNPSD